MLYDNETFERGGEQFHVAFPSDDFGRLPWEDDGRGLVSDWTSRAKAPGERELCSDRSSRRFYDFAETMKIAKRDGWGLGEDDKAKLADKLGHAPSRKEIIAEAVERDFEYLRRFCNDQWSYVGVVVTLLDDDGEKTDKQDSLWGIESDCDDYLESTAYELADKILHQLAAQRDRDATIAAAQMEAARPDMYGKL
jgi:hypothetical protein